MKTEERDKEKKGQNIMKSMLDMRNRMSADSAGYSCHTESPYRDGYGDAGYGDYNDV